MSSQDIYKSLDVKIIQIISYTDRPQGGDHTFFEEIFGLGSDGIIYRYNEYKKDWYY